jgi:MSHA biogenesis protein MshM
MYESYFGLKEKPFSLSPDTEYFFCHEGQREALNTLLIALDSGEGFVKVIGEVGTGKTLLCRELLNRLDAQRFYTAYIPNPYLSPGGLRMALGAELGIPSNKLHDHNRLVNHIYERLIELNAQKKQVVLCLDEVQAMPDKTLEALRLLTNLETEKRKLLQVVLFGQPELNEKLNEAHIRQLRQRIIYSVNLAPLDVQRVAGYVRHRLIVAGYSGEFLFSKSALEKVYRASRGVPRLINILCSKAMLLAYGKGDAIIKSKHVAAAVEDTEGLNPISFLEWHGFNVAIMMSVSGLSLATLSWWMNAG